MIRIFIAGLPLPPNEARREHWSARSADSKVFREAALMTAMQAMRMARNETFPYDPAAVRYDFVLEARRGDLDGLVAAAKPILDGIVDAGVIVDDRVGKLERLEAGWFLGPRRGVWIAMGAADEQLPRMLA